MYRCAICQGVSPPRQSRLVHRVFRPDKSIQQEIPICKGCQEGLSASNSNVLTLLDLVLNPTSTPPPKPLKPKKTLGVSVLVSNPKPLIPMRKRA